MSISLPDIADAVHAGLLEQARAEDLEQAVSGFDSLSELGLHPIIHRAMRAAGYGVWPEQRYPGDQRHGRRSEGKRCDLVLTPSPGALPLRDPDTLHTLFGTQPAVELEDALWVEVKSVAQFEAGEPFRRYSAELLAPVSEDVMKLWRDGVIRHAALLLLLFTTAEDVAAHDLAAWHGRCVDRNYPVATPVIRGFPITNRTGNAWCAAAIFGIRGA